MLSSDVIRKQLAGIPTGDRRHYDDFEGGIYSSEFTARTYAELFRRAGQVIETGQSVILDASFKKKEDRLAAFDLAKAMGAGFLAIECTADEDTIKQRLEKRKREGAVSDGRWEIFADVRRDFESVDELPASNHMST